MTKYTDEELKVAQAAHEAQAAFDAASEEERAEFRASGENFETTAAECFILWRDRKREKLVFERYEAASPDERLVIEAEHPDEALSFQRALKREERRTFLAGYGFGEGVDGSYRLSTLPDHLWDQISSLIAGGHIKPAPAPSSGVDAA